MIVDGFALAIVTTIGFWLIYSKIPDRVKTFLERHSLATDLTACILVYMFLGGTLVALFAGAFVGIFVSIMLYVQNHKEDFMYLFDLRDWISEQLSALKVQMNEFGKTYRHAQNKE